MKIFKRNPRGQEKRVDGALIIDVTKLIYKLRLNPDGEIIIVAGDLDYYDLVGEIKDAGWNARIVCWRHATAAPVRRLSQYEDLTPNLTKVGFFENTNSSTSTANGARPLTGPRLFRIENQRNTLRSSCEKHPSPPTWKRSRDHPKSSECIHGMLARSFIKYETARGAIS